jgi:hypothetical protein
MKLYVQILAGISLLSSGAFGQEILRVEKMSCLSGDECELDRSSTDGGNSFKSTEGTIFLSDPQILKKTKPSIPKGSVDTSEIKVDGREDATSMLSFKRDAHGNIQGLATKEALEEVFAKQKDNKELKRIKELEKSVLAEIEAVLGKDSHLVLKETITYSSDDQSFEKSNISIGRPSEEYNSGVAYFISVMDEKDLKSLHENLLQTKQYNDAETAAKNARPQNLLSETSLMKLKAARQQHVKKAEDLAKEKADQ